MVQPSCHHSGIADGGAGIGAASGGVLGWGANALTYGKEIDPMPEQLLQFRASSPLDVRIMLVDGNNLFPKPRLQLSSRPAPIRQQRDCIKDLSYE